MEVVLVSPSNGSGLSVLIVPEVDKSDALKVRWSLGVDPHTDNGSGWLEMREGAGDKDPGAVVVTSLGGVVFREEYYLSNT